MPVLFYGPGGGEYIDWQTFQVEFNTDRALDAGVPESVVRENLILNVGSHGRFNFNGLSKAYAQRQVKRRIKAYTLLITLQYGIPFITRQVAYRRMLAYGTTSSVARVTTREAVETAVFRVLIRKAPTRVLTRFIPYLGWGLAGYDIYTILFHGSLWGVQIYEKD
tara:strand:+ start:69 stop:563 length:495 start_codon:yes stop_codon:yes gene_type:complete